MDDIDFKIIIIDDNPKIAQDVIKVLSNKKNTSSEFNALDLALFGENDQGEKPDMILPKFSFCTATQGQEGLEKIKEAFEKKTPYALAFVDVRMPPGWDGIETIKHIWAVDPDIQIVICTAFSDYSWEETVHELGVNAGFLILKKPFDNLALRQLACALTQKWRLEKKERLNTDYLNKEIATKTKSLVQAVSLLRTVFDSTMEGILLLDLEQKIIDYNVRLNDLFSIPQSVLSSKSGKDILSYISTLLISALPPLEKIAINKPNDFLFKEVLYLKEDITYEVTSKPYYLNEIIVGRFWSFLDISDRALLEKKLTYQATHDPLTNLPNRYLLRDRIELSILSATRNHKLSAILFFALDRFKLVNDSLGRHFGDKLLCAAASRISALLRKCDTVARVGGDEFVIVLPLLSKKEDARHLTEKLLRAFQAPFILDSHEIDLTTSIGISLYPIDGQTVDVLLTNADLAMYQAKNKCRNQYYFYSETLQNESSQKLELISELSHGIDEKQFVLHYQPQFNFKTGKFVGAEALIRWQHPKKGMIFPDHFIPAAEESGLIVGLGELVIREACQQMSAWKKEGLAPFKVAVNVSSWQLKHKNFDEIVESILKEFQIDKKYFQLEITENVIVNQADIVAMIIKLRAKGFKIILDDFGTGNSSLNYLTEIPIDGLKIDRSFVKNIAKSLNDEVIIEAMINIANNLKLKLVAEGVDSKHQADFLKERNCGEVQGFLYSKPVSALDLTAYLKEGKSLPCIASLS